jgi:myo-inositol 2-dehydrogenase / D-chiro-inositol 1-dehydrogenase
MAKIVTDDAPVTEIWSREAFCELGHGDLDADAILDGLRGISFGGWHAQIVGEAAARGLPILCEKPCGVTIAQARKAAEAAAAAQVPFQVAYWRRYVPALRALRDRVAAGDLGTVHLVACYQWDAEPPSAAFRAHSGGIFIDMGVHEFDQLRWLTGQDIGTLRAVVSGVVPDGLGEPPDQAPDAIAALAAAEQAGADVPALSGAGPRSPGA